MWEGVVTPFEAIDEEAQGGEAQAMKGGIFIQELLGAGPFRN